MVNRSQGFGSEGGYLELRETERGCKMALTKRGKRVKAVAIALLWLALLALVNYLTTPKICRGEVETLSQYCLDLRFPN